MFKFVKLAYLCVLYYANYHYTMVKFFLGKLIKYDLVVNILSLMLGIIYMILNTMLVIICGFYRLVIWIGLKAWYRKKFRRFVPGCGLVTTFNEMDYGHISILVTISSTKTGDQLYKEVYEQISEKFFVDSAMKLDLFCLKKTRFGYQFLINADDVDIDEVFKKLETPKEYLNEEELMELAKKFFNSKLPRDNEFAWDILFCTTPLIIDDVINTNGERVYAFMLRIGHALGDGLVVYNLLSNAFSKPDPAKNQYVKKLTQPNAKTDKLKKACPAHVVNLHRGPWKKRDLIWTDATLETGKFVSVRRNCLWKIRDIRKCFPGVSFLNVVYAAYSASFADYFAKYHENEIPKDINILAPMQISSNRIKKLLQENGKNDFDNDFSAFLIKCPLAIDNAGSKSDILVERLLLIKHEFEKVFNSFDIQGLYIIFKIFLNTFPIPLIKKLLSRMFFGTMMSCIPGGPKVKFFEGSTVENVAFFLPRQHCYAIAMGILTYGDQMQLGITLDDAKFVNKEHCDTLIDGFFRYIDLLHDFCAKKCENVSKL